MTRDADDGFERRQILKCMLWAGTGVVWTVAGGVPASRLLGSAKAAEGGFSFVQLSDSHIGFAKAANPDARATFDAAIDKVLAMPGKPAFVLHTGDVTHTAKPAEFDDALGMIERASIDVQIATARAFPRSMEVFKKRAMAMVTPPRVCTRSASRSTSASCEG